MCEVTAHGKHCLPHDFEKDNTAGARIYGVSNVLKNMFLTVLKIQEKR